MDCTQGQACQHSYSCPDSKLQMTHSHIPRQPTFDNHKIIFKVKFSQTNCWHSSAKRDVPLWWEQKCTDGVKPQSCCGDTALCAERRHTAVTRSLGFLPQPSTARTGMAQWEARKALRSSLYTRHTKQDTRIYKMLALISYVMTQRITGLFISNTAATGSATNSSRASPRTELQTSLQAEIQRKHLRVRWTSAPAKTHTDTHTDTHSGQARDASSPARHSHCRDYRLPPLLERPLQWCSYSKEEQKYIKPL